MSFSLYLKGTYSGAGLDLSIKATLESPVYFSGAYWPPSITINDSLSLLLTHTLMENQLCVFGFAAHIKLPHYETTGGKKGPNSLSNPCGEDIHFKIIPSMIANLLLVNFEQLFVTHLTRS